MPRPLEINVLLYQHTNVLINAIAALTPDRLTIQRRSERPVQFGELCRCE